VGDVREIALPLRGTMANVELVAELAKDGAGALGETLRAIARDDLETVMILPDGDKAAEASGPDGFLGLWRDWTASYERFDIEPLSDPVANGEAMVNTVRQRGVIAGSDAEVLAEGSAAWFFREGKLARIEFHLSHERALRSIGLEPTDEDGTLPA
jgi:hypothetical protein